MSNKYDEYLHINNDWEKVGGDVDLSSKQDKLTAGEGIEIENNVISATNQQSLTPGTGIQINSNDVISTDAVRIFTGNTLGPLLAENYPGIKAGDLYNYSNGNFTEHYRVYYVHNYSGTMRAYLELIDAHIAQDSPIGKTYENFESIGFRPTVGCIWVQSIDASTYVPYLLTNITGSIPYLNYTWQQANWATESYVNSQVSPLNDKFTHLGDVEYQVSVETTVVQDFSQDNIVYYYDSPYTKGINVNEPKDGIVYLHIPNYQEIAQTIGSTVLGVGYGYGMSSDVIASGGGPVMLDLSQEVTEVSLKNIGSSDYPYKFISMSYYYDGSNHTLPSNCYIEYVKESTETKTINTEFYNLGDIKFKSGEPIVQWVEYNLADYYIEKTSVAGHSMTRYQFKGILIYDIDLDNVYIDYEGDIFDTTQDGVTLACEQGTTSSSTNTGGLSTISISKVANQNTLKLNITLQSGHSSYPYDFIDMYKNQYPTFPPIFNDLSNNLDKVTLRYALKDVVYEEKTINGNLQDKIDSDNKLPADYVDDTSSTNKFLPAATSSDEGKVVSVDSNGNYVLVNINELT